MSAESNAHVLEHGFWDYTTPGAGGMEHYERDDYLRLLDDMSQAGMNSICVLPKWLTTGYRSRLPFLDQHADNPTTRSDNALLRHFLAEAKRRGIKPWLGVVIAMYPAEHVRTPAIQIHPPDHGNLRLGVSIGVYDLDCPEVWDYAPQVLAELCREFPCIEGLAIEVEWAGMALPHRIPLYNRWAAENGQPAFEKINNPLNLRVMDVSPWRSYTTQRRIEFMRHLRAAVSAYPGEWAMLCETGRSPYLLTQEVDLRLLARECPWCAAVSYECQYDKSFHRLGTMELAVEDSKQAGLKTFYLPRGVMTWGPWPMALPLEESWRRDTEDILRFLPQGVWWFGSGCVETGRGSHVDAERLRQSRFADGTQARRRLLERARRIAEA
jgi:hypothetical protein